MNMLLSHDFFHSLFVVYVCSCTQFTEVEIQILIIGTDHAYYTVL